VNRVTAQLVAIALLTTLPFQFLAFGRGITATVFAGIAAVLGALVVLL
jgi:hypothetical protein